VPGEMAKCFIQRSGYTCYSTLTGRHVPSIDVFIRPERAFVFCNLTFFRNSNFILEAESKRSLRNIVSTEQYKASSTSNIIQMVSSKRIRCAVHVRGLRNYRTK